MKPKPSGPIWIIYDARGHFDTDDAAVLVMCDSLREVYESKHDFPADSAVYKYDVNGHEVDYLGMLGNVRRTR